MKIILILLLSFSSLPIFAQNITFDEQLLTSEEYSKLVDRIQELENQPTFDEKLLDSNEFQNILYRLKILENNIHEHDLPWVGISGILLSIVGAIFMLRYWSDPFERHLENWVKIITVAFPNSYKKRIVRDFNYWRDYQDKGKDSPHTEPWMIPYGFAIYWRNMKLLSFFSMIGGFALQAVQLMVL